MELFTYVNLTLFILNESDTKHDIVETYSDAKKCAERFKEIKERLPKLF